MEATVSPWNEFKIRIGNTAFWGLSGFLYILVVVAILSFTFDAVRLKNYTLAWIPLNVLAITIGFIFVYLSIRIFKVNPKSQKPKPVFNVVVASLSMGIKNVATLALCPLFGIEDQGVFLYRMVGGFSIGLAMILVFNALLGSKLAREKNLLALEEKERELLGFRENVSELFKDEEQQISERTSASLTPRILEFQNQASSNSNLVSMALELKRFAIDEVRPLSHNLAAQAALLKNSVKSFKETKVQEPKTYIALGKTIRPVSTLLLAFFGWFSLSPLVLPEATILDLFVAALVFLLSMGVIKYLAKSIKQIELGKALVFIPIIAAANSVAPYVLMYLIPHTPNEGELLPSLYVVSALSAMTTSYIYCIDMSRLVVEERLRVIVDGFARENKLFEQKLWVAKYSWAAKLHGTVQAALTAASLRLARSSNPSPKVIAEVVTDLQRAIDALKVSGQPEISLKDCLADIALAWEGICQVEYDLDTSWNTEEEFSVETKIVLNEIIKEAVSNAVRHGLAKKVAVQLQLTSEGDLLLLVSNNGTEPIFSGKETLGMKTFDALCSEFELRWNMDTGVTELEARIPLAVA